MAVARLRKTIEPLSRSETVRLATVTGGYMLEVAPEQLDAELFAAGVRAGRDALEAHDVVPALQLLSDALSLWRGSPLAEVAFADFAQSEIRRLDELRLVALEARIDADLALGNHGRVIGELEALVIEQPTREHLAGLLMVALYRSGRQADALGVYQRVRTSLAAELGLDPGPALQKLQTQILEHDPSLRVGVQGRVAPEAEASSTTSVQPGRRVTAPLPTRLQPYGPPVFVDRENERARLTAALADAGSSGRLAAFVTGEPGIGKTRLVSEIALQAHRSGTLVIGGRCDEGLELPYQPFVEALEYLIEYAPRELLEAHVHEYGNSVARLVPALAARVGDRAVTAGEPSESERYALFRSIEGLLAAASAVGSLLLILEDLHWADVPTVNLLRRLLTSPRTPPLLVLSTCRLGGLAADHVMRGLLADLHREPHVLRLELGGLGTSDVNELVRGLAGGAVTSLDEQLAPALNASTNGNPFFITELVRSLSETGALVNAEGHWQLAEGVEVADQMPVSISETLAKRLRSMGDAVKDCLRVASVVGIEFEPGLVSEVSTSADEAVADALDAAIDGAVLIEVPGSAARLRFSHALVHRFLYTELGSPRRAQLHKRVAMAIEERTPPTERPVAELARHWLGAGDGEGANAIKYTTAAGDDALAKLAPDEARRWYETSLELLQRKRGSDDPMVCELLIRRGEAERQAGDRAFRDTLLEAAELAMAIGDDERLVRAALANTRGMQSETGIVDQPRVDVITAALRLVGDGDSAERAQLLAMHAGELMYSQDWERRVRISDEALAIARRVGDPEALSAVLNMRFVTLLAPDTLAERTANALEAVAVAERLRDPLLRFFAYHWCTYACLEAGEIETARSWAAQEREIADRYRQPTTLWLARADAANLAIVAGELETAAGLAAAALEIGRNSEPDALACFAAQQTSIAFEAGGLAELVPLLERAVTANPGVPGFRATLALALLQAARHEEARALLTDAAATGFADVPHDVTWLTVLCIYGHLSAQLEVPSAAKTIYDLVLPWQDQIVFPAFGVWGPVELYLGALAAAVGELKEAKRHFDGAARVARRALAPVWEARAADALSRLTDNST